MNPLPGRIRVVWLAAGLALGDLQFLEEFISVNQFDWIAP
jgi:hypothetical protein